MNRIPVEFITINTWDFWEYFWNSWNSIKSYTASFHHFIETLKSILSERIFINHSISLDLENSHFKPSTPTENFSSIQNKEKKSQLKLLSDESVYIQMDVSKFLKLQNKDRLLLQLHKELYYISTAIYDEFREGVYNTPKNCLSK